MTNLPLQHFRRGVAQYAATPEAHAMIFAGTGVTAQMLASPDFALTPEILWAVCDNITTRVGPGWYCHLPALWALDVQSDFESAMRVAPTLRDAMYAVERYGPLRWPIIRWRNSLVGDNLISVSYRNCVISPANWQMLGILSKLNFETILEAAFPATIGRIVHDISGEPPLPREQIEKLFRNRIRWNAAVHTTVIPRDLLDLPSALADSRTFATTTAILDTLPLARPAGWKVRTLNVLGDLPSRRQSGMEVASVLGISLRSLERHLATEGSSFRGVRDLYLKSQFENLMRSTDQNLAAIAERLGYSDESALSRATRRWHGCSAAEARKRVRAAAE